MALLVIVATALDLLFVFSLAAHFEAVNNDSIVHSKLGYGYVLLRNVPLLMLLPGSIGISVFAAFHVFLVYTGQVSYKFWRSKSLSAKLPPANSASIGRELDFSRTKDEEADLNLNIAEVELSSLLENPKWK